MNEHGEASNHAPNMIPTVSPQTAGLYITKNVSDTMTAPSGSNEAACRSFRLFESLRHTLLVERLGRLFSLLFLSILTFAHSAPFRRSIRGAARVVAMKSSVAFPVVAGVVQMSIRGDSYGDTSGLLAAEASLTFPTASGARQECIRRYVDGNARCCLRELETTIAFPTWTI